MREIKFRAYDEANKEMVYSNKEDCFYVNTKGVMFMYSHPKSVAGQIKDYIKDYGVMQFTGLKDCNGVDIYKGDVVRHSNRNKVVEYICDIAAFGFGLSDHVYCQESGVYGPEMEVIGNIHESPELIKGER